MVCSEQIYKYSKEGSERLLLFKNQLFTRERPFNSSYFTTAFLKEFYKQNVRSIDENIFNCYESLLEFWAKERSNALNQEYSLGTGNKTYEDWVKNYKNPIEKLFDLLKNIPVALVALSVILLINQSRK